MKRLGLLCLSVSVLIFFLAGYVRAPWAAGFVAVLGAVLGAILGLLFSDRGLGRSTSPSNDCDEAAELIREVVERVCREAWIARGLHDWTAIDVEWNVTTRTVGFCPPAGLLFEKARDDVYGSTSIEPINALLGIGGRLRDVAERYQRIATGRLAFVGESGSGKSVLTLYLIRQMVASPSSSPIPVLLRCSEWRTARWDLTDFITSQLLQDKQLASRLPSPRKSRRLVQQLLATGRLFPVLDGLDELPPRPRTRAIKKLRAEMATRERRLILNCRLTEFNDAMAEFGKVAPIPGLVVAELLPVSPERAEKFFINLTTNVEMSSRPEQQAKIFASAQSGSKAWRGILSSPLTLSTLPHVLMGRRADTGVVDRISAATTEDDARRQLMSEFISQQYPDRGSFEAETLSLIASHMRRHNEQRFSWWGLVEVVPRTTRFGATLVIACLAGGIPGLAIGSLSTYSGAAAICAIFGMLSGVVSWCAASGIMALRGRGLAPAYPSSLAARRPRVSDLKVGLFVGVAIAAILWPAAAVVVGQEKARAIGLFCGAAIGVTTVALSAVLTHPEKRQIENESLRGSMRSDVGAALFFCGSVSVISGGLALATGVREADMAAAIAIGVSVSTGVFAGLFPNSYSGRFRVFSTWLLVHQRRWGSVVSALENAASFKGVIRQSGPWHEFRHAELLAAFADYGS